MDKNLLNSIQRTSSHSIELSDLFHEQELYEQAIAQHEAIIELKKDDPYRVCLSLREIGKIHEDTGAYDDARARYDEALALTAPGNWLKKRPSTPYYWDLRRRCKLERLNHILRRQT